MKTLGFILFACMVVTVRTGPALSSPSSMGFLENRGQMDPDVRYYSHAPSVSVYLTDKAIVLGLHSEGPTPPARNSAKGEALDRSSGGEPAGVDDRSARSLVTYGLSIGFDEANRSPRIEALDPLPGRYNFLIGNDPEGWHTNIESFRQIIYHDLWPGIDLVFTLTPSGLSYDAVVRPGADTGQIAFAYDGADRVTEAQGSRHIEAVDRMLLQESTTPTRGDFRWAFGASCPTVSCPDQNDEPQRPELLVWSTLLGGNGPESAYALVHDPDGAIVLAGAANGPDYPTTPGAYDTLSSLSSGSDAFITKLSPDGSTLLWSTYVGDTCTDAAYDLAIDAAGNPVIVGITKSDLFPTTLGAYDNTANCTGCGGCYDVFVLKMAATGDQLVWSTFLGASGPEGNSASIAIDPSGHPIVAGEARSGFPTTSNAFDPSANGGLDAFVSILAEDGGSLLYSTYLGGNRDDEPRSVAVDAFGHPYVTGYTASGNFPVLGKGQQEFGGGRDVFVAKLDPELSTLLFSTILGGSGADQGNEVYCDTDRVLVSGYTYSNDFPVTPGAFDETHNGDGDAFVACLKADNGWLVWNTYLGGANLDGASDIAYDPAGAVVVKGTTHSGDFPVTANAYDGTFNGDAADPSSCSDFFLTVLSVQGESASMSTYVGGSHVESARGLMLEEGGYALLAGDTGSCDFPFTPGAYDSIITDTFGDVVVAKLRYERPAPPVSVTSPDNRDLGFEVITLPNPSQHGTTFRFDARRKGPFEVSIRDVAGRTVWASRHTELSPGHDEIFWDGMDRVGLRCRPGVYLYTVRVGRNESRGRITLLR